MAREYAISLNHFHFLFVISLILGAFWLRFLVRQLAYPWGRRSHAEVLSSRNAQGAELVSFSYATYFGEHCGGKIKNISWIENTYVLRIVLFLILTLLLILSPDISSGNVENWNTRLFECVGLPGWEPCFGGTADVINCEFCRLQLVHFCDE